MAKENESKKILSKRNLVLLTILFCLVVLGITLYLVNYPIKWKFHIENDFPNTIPVISDEIVYFCSQGGFNTSTFLFAINNETGQLLWKYKLHSSDYNTRALVAYNTVYVTDCGEGSLNALDARTGNMKWKVTSGSNVRSTPAIIENTVFFGSYDKNLYAVDAISGNVKWKYPNEYIITDFTVDEDTVYFGTENTYYAIDAATGKERWTQEFGGLLREPGVVKDGKIYFLRGVRQGQGECYFCALDKETGDILWKTNTPEAGGHIHPVIFEDIICFIGPNSSLLALDVNTGNKRWEFKYGGSEGARGLSPAIYDGLIYYCIEDTHAGDNKDSGGVYVIDAKTGNLIHSMKMTTSPAPPAAENGIVYLSSLNGYLYAFEALTKPNVSWPKKIDDKEKLNLWEKLCKFIKSIKK